MIKKIVQKCKINYITILIGEAVLSGEKKLVFVLNNLNLRMTQNSFHDELVIS